MPSCAKRYAKLAAVHSPATRSENTSTSSEKRFDVVTAVKGQSGRFRKYIMRVFMDSDLAFCGSYARELAWRPKPCRCTCKSARQKALTASASPCKWRASLQEPKRPKRPSHPDSKSKSNGDGNRSGGVNAESLAPLGSAGGPARVNSALMQAMSDYFGDDGRELEEYTKHPRNAAGEIVLRVLLIGSGEAEVALAHIIHKSDRARGLYYAPDDTNVTEEQLGLTDIAQSCTVGAYDREKDIIRFCEWAFVDVVFVGPDRNGCIGKETEAALAELGVTVFPHDVSAAIAAGTMSVTECFRSLSEEIEENARPNEQLVE